MDAPLRFGVNYVPSHDWMHAWLSMSPDRVRRDLDGIAALGLDHIRVMPLWPVLQPNRTLIRQQALEDVRLVVDLAAERGLDASVDVIQGHLSSFDFVPAWLYSWHDRNMFTHPEALEGQLALVRALGGALAGAPNLLGLTLGNELNQFADDPHPHPWRCTAREAEHWITSLLDAAEETLPGLDHVHSEYDAVWYLDGHPFLPAHAARLGAMTTIHSWVFNGTAQFYGAGSTAVDHHAEYLIELGRAFAVDPHRPTWLQEVGAPSNCLTPAQMPDFLEATVRAGATTDNLWGVTWWCSHDVARSLSDFPDLEHSLGLIDERDAVKPIGERFAELAAELRGGVTALPRPLGIVVDVDEAGTPVDRTSLSPGGAVFQRWVDLRADGAAPAFVTSLDAEDPSALAARGISEVVRVDRSASPLGRYSAVNTVVVG